MCLNDVKGVDLATIDHFYYGNENLTSDTYRGEEIWSRDRFPKLHLRGPIHVSVALIFRGAWCSGQREHGRAPYKGFDLPWTTNLLSDSKELYLTKEALSERLSRRLSPTYEGNAFQQFLSQQGLTSFSKPVREICR